MKVKIKNKEWYDQHKSKDGNVYDEHGGVIMNKEQSEYCGQIFIVDNVYFHNEHGCFLYEFQDCPLRWRGESFDKLDIGEYLENELNEYGQQQVQEIIKSHKIKELIDKFQKMGVIK